MIIQPLSYFGAPVAASAAGGYIVRSDANASSVSLALPGTQFGSTFGQNSYRSDISSYVSGTGTSLADPPVTGSPAFPSSSIYWTSSDGYSTSMSKGAGSVSFYTIPGTSANVNFGSGAWTVEGYFSPRSSGTGDIVLYLNYFGNGSGFVLWSSAGYYRWVAQNGAGGETLTDYATTNPAQDTWHHLMFCRSGNSWYGGVDGTIRGVLTLTGATGTGAPYHCMNWAGSTGQRASTWQDFRITKGVARYTGTSGTAYTQPSSIVTLG